jgi:hypothetical protein
MTIVEVDRKILDYFRANFEKFENQTSYHSALALAIKSNKMLLTIADISSGPYFLL